MQNTIRCHYKRIIEFRMCRRPSFQTHIFFAFFHDIFVKQFVYRKFNFLVNCTFHHFALNHFDFIAPNKLNEMKMFDVDSFENAISGTTSVNNSYEYMLKSIILNQSDKAN